MAIATPTILKLEAIFGEVMVATLQLQQTLAKLRTIETTQMPDAERASHKSRCTKILMDYLDKIPGGDVLAIQTLHFEFPTVPFHTRAEWLVLLIDRICGACDKQGKERNEHYKKMCNTYLSRPSTIATILKGVSRENWVKNVCITFEGNVTEAFIGIFSYSLNGKQKVEGIFPQGINVTRGTNDNKRKLRCNMQAVRLTDKQKKFAYEALGKPKDDQDEVRQCYAYALMRLEYRSQFKSASTPQTGSPGTFSRNYKAERLKHFYALLNNNKGLYIIHIRANGSSKVSLASSAPTATAAASVITSTTAATATTIVATTPKATPPLLANFQKAMSKISVYDWIKGVAIVFDSPVPDELVTSLMTFVREKVKDNYNSAFSTGIYLSKYDMQGKKFEFKISSDLLKPEEQTLLRELLAQGYKGDTRFLTQAFCLAQNESDRMIGKKPLWNSTKEKMEEVQRNQAALASVANETIRAGMIKKLLTECFKETCTAITNAVPKQITIQTNGEATVQMLGSANATPMDYTPSYSSSSSAASSSSSTPMNKRWAKK